MLHLHCIQQTDISSYYSLIDNWQIILAKMTYIVDKEQAWFSHLLLVVYRQAVDIGNLT